MNGTTTRGWFARIISGGIGRSAVAAGLMVIALGSVAVSGSVASADENFQPFSDDIEKPFLSAKLDGTDVPDSESDIDPIDARFLQMQRELDQLKASLELSGMKAEAANSAANRHATNV